MITAITVIFTFPKLFGDHAGEPGFLLILQFIEELFFNKMKIIKRKMISMPECMILKKEKKKSSLATDLH